MNSIGLNYRGKTITVPLTNVDRTGNGREIAEWMFNYSPWRGKASVEFWNRLSQDILNIVNRYENK